MKIGKTELNEDSPCYIVAEIGINHNGRLETVEKLIDVAVNAGCDAVKFQKRDVGISIPLELWDRDKETPWGTMKYIDYKRKLEFGYEEYEHIDWYCRCKEITWFASAWDLPSLGFLEDFGVPCHKVASALNVYRPLVDAMIETKKPIVYSMAGLTSGMVAEVKKWFPKFYPVIWTHCRALYPCEDCYLNLEVIKALAWSKEDGQLVGYSGHEKGLATTVGAVAFGAKYVERHITLDRAMWGSDQAASLEPQGIKRLVRDIRAFETARGSGFKDVLTDEIAKLETMRYWK